MFGSCTSVVDTIMDDDFAAGWGEWCLVEVERAIDMGVGRDIGINSGRTEEIEC